MTETRNCPQCGREFTPKAKHQIYDVDPCRYQGWIQKEVEAAEAGSQRVDGHPLQLVREDQAAKKHNRDLGGLIRQAIIDQIKTTGECFADDLVELYPEGEVKECRRLATAQFGSMVSSGVIREKERRKSKFSTRKGGKSGVYIFTQKGREQLVGVGGESAGGGPAPLPAALTSHSDETPGADDSLGVLTGGSSSVPDSSDQPLAGVSAGRPTPQGAEGLEGQKPAGVHSGKSSAAVSSRSKDAGEVSESTSHHAAAEPACLPGFEESAAARHLQDAA